MGKLTRDQARKAMKRIFANPMLAPQSEEGTKEIIDCLIRNCRDQAHAEQTMTVFLDNAKDPRNTTAEIKAAAGVVDKENWENETPPSGCDKCTVTDINGERFLAHVIRLSSTGIEYAGRCSCVRGRWLASRDLRRAKDAEAARDAVATTAMQERGE